MTRAAPPSAHRPSPTVIHACPRSIRPLPPPFSPVLSGGAAREGRVPRDRSCPWRDFAGLLCSIFAASYGEHARAPNAVFMWRADEAEQLPICELLQIIVCVV